MSSGWGCAVCGLDVDGAVAILCDACAEAGEKAVFVVIGYMPEGRRFPVDQLEIKPHQCDLAKHAEYERTMARMQAAVAPARSRRPVLN